MITILNYGLGNLLSIKNMLKRVGVDCVITSSISDVKDATKIILPGVGHFDYGMKKLKSADFFEVLNEKIFEQKVPLLGICLGAQMLLNGSQEGVEAGLGWIEGTCKKINFENQQTALPIPNMGWQDVTYIKQTPLNAGIEDDPRYYFVHSYCMECSNPDNVIGKSHYGYDYTVAIAKNNIYGVQFHPEKSHRFGMQVLKNFAGL